MKATTQEQLLERIRVSRPPIIQKQLDGNYTVSCRCCKFLGTIIYQQMGAPGVEYSIVLRPEFGEHHVYNDEHDEPGSFFECFVYSTHIDGDNERAKLWNAEHAAATRHFAQGHGKETLPDGNDLMFAIEDKVEDLLRLGLRAKGFEFHQQNLPIYVCCPHCAQVTELGTLVQETP